jgi:hypothetical protein
MSTPTVEGRKTPCLRPNRECLRIMTFWNIAMSEAYHNTLRLARQNRQGFGPREPPLPEEDLEIVCHGLEARGECPRLDNGSEPLTRLHVRTIV